MYFNLKDCFIKFAGPLIAAISAPIGRSFANPAGERRHRLDHGRGGKCAANYYLLSYSSFSGFLVLFDLLRLGLLLSCDTGKCEGEEPANVDQFHPSRRPRRPSWRDGARNGAEGAMDANSIYKM